MQDIVVVISNRNENISPLKTIDVVKAAGFTNIFIQWFNEPWEVSQEEQLQYAKKSGLKIIFAHLSCQNVNSIWEDGRMGDELVKEYKKDILICNNNDIPMVIMHLTGGIIAPLQNEIGLNRFREIADYAKSLGVKIAFENTRIKGYLSYVLKNINNDNVGICYDAGHCHAHFDDEFDYTRFKDRIFAVHLHDNDKSGDQHLLPFDGTIDWEFVTDKLKENNYKGPVTLELVYAGDYLNIAPLEFYEKGYQIGEKLLTMML